MQKIDKLTNSILIKSQKRFLKSEYSNLHTLGSSFNDTEYKFEGMYRSYKEWILSKNEEFYIVPMSTQSISTNLITGEIEKENKQIEINLVQIADLEYDDAIFIPMKTGDAIDYMFSSEGGVYPGTNYIVIGDPGIGKSTQTLDMLAKVKKLDPTKKVLFISGEMNQIDMFGYVKRYPEFGRIPTLFLCDYLDSDPREVIEQTYKQGWDLILIDSFIEVQEAIQSTSGMSRTQAEKWMIDLMVKNNKGANDLKKYSTFLAIQQVTKGGNFVGSNKLKHNTTGMIELRYSLEFSGDRYAKVTKNRRGFKYEKIYFSLERQDSVEYDQKRLDRDEEIHRRLSREKELLFNEEEKFNQVFGVNQKVEEFEEDEF